VLTPQTRLRPNDQDVAAKVLEGEAIIINLSNGIYYSMENVGAFIWEQIDAGHSLGEIVATLTAKYDVSAQQARADVERLAGELVDEGIVQPTQDDGSSRDRPRAVGDTGLPYDSPRLEIYRDIGHLLALDPPMPGLGDVPWNAAPQDAPGEPRS
jgi:hypothetical protein